MIGKNEFLKNWMLRYVPLGFVNPPREISSLLKIADGQPYLISVLRYAVYIGLLTDKRILENMGDSQMSKRIKREQIPVLESAEEQYKSGQDMNIFGIIIPLSDVEISEEDMELIDRYGRYDY